VGKCRTLGTQPRTRFTVRDPSINTLNQDSRLYPDTRSFSKGNLCTVGPLRRYRRTKRRSGGRSPNKSRISGTRAMSRPDSSRLPKSNRIRRTNIMTRHTRYDKVGYLKNDWYLSTLNPKQWNHRGYPERMTRSIKSQIKRIAQRIECRCQLAM
jgi:hypothetical protein